MPEVAFFSLSYSLRLDQLGLLCLGNSFLALVSLWALGLLQRFSLGNLLAMASPFAYSFWPSFILGSLLALGHLHPLALVTSLARPIGGLRGWKKGQVIRSCSSVIVAGATSVSRLATALETSQRSCG